MLTQPSWKSALYICALAFAARLMWELGAVAWNRLYEEWEPMGRPPVLSSSLAAAALLYLALAVYRTRQSSTSAPARQPHPTH